MESQEYVPDEFNDQLISASPVMRGSATGRLRTTGLLSERVPQLADRSLVVETLRWCASVYGTQRARFVRRLTDGAWVVQTLVDGTVVSQPADRAEIAMAWSVGLSRQPVMATRPRVATLDGDGVRPIAVTRYVGIPVLCHDEFLGIIEVAGSIRSDLHIASAESASRLSRFAERLLRDTSLWAEPDDIHDDARCEISRAPAAGSITLSVEEWQFVSALECSMRIDEVAARVAIPEERLPAVARALLSRGLITLRAPTRPLSDMSSVTPPDSPSMSAASSADTYASYSGAQSD